MMPKLYLTLTISFVMVCLSIWLLRPLAFRIGLVDSPGGRKLHSGEVPLIGGIAIFLGFVFALLTLNISLSGFRSFIAAGGLLVFIGILDDFHELNAPVRLIGQIFAAFLMATWGGICLHSFGNLIFTGPIYLGLLALPISIFATVGIINAVNMTDGVDGLAGTLVLAQLSLIALVAYLGHRHIDVNILSILITSLLAFLFFNFRIPGRRQALIFMGDAGSMFLGLALTWFLISLSQGQHAAAAPVTMLWIMIVPLFDTTRLMIMRVLAGRSPFSPDRQHIHHILIKAGFSQRATVIILALVTIISGLIAIAAWHWHIAEGYMFISYISLFVIFYLSVVLVGRQRYDSREAQLQ